MENRKGTALRITKRPAQIFTPSCFLCCVFLFSAGDGVQLSFTLPSNSIIGEKLPGPPAVEILRGTVKPDGSADAKSFRVVYTIPGALVENYRADGRVSFTDPIAPEETKAHPGGAVTYVVRTRASQKRSSADSNVISVRV